MWIVRLALRRPYTFVVMSVAILLLGIASIITMPIDIFPYIDIPVVSVVWNYAGMSPAEMESRILTVFERGMTTTVNDIEHIESQSYYGVSVVRSLFSAQREDRHGDGADHRAMRTPSRAPCRPEFFRRTSSSTTHPACPSSNWAWKARP